MILQNKTALITGGGSGIGLAISKHLIANKVKVIICGRTESKLKRAKELHPELEYECCDITDSVEIKGLVDKLNNKYGGIDILVNNAGAFTQFDYRLNELSFEDQLAEIEIDFTAPLRMIHHFLPMLKSKPEAAVANVSSFLAKVPLTLAPVYCAAKAGVHSWTKSFRYQMRESSIKVFELMPLLVETEMTANLDGPKKMKPEDLAFTFVEGLTKNKYEIYPGQSSIVNILNKWMPKLAFNAINKPFLN